MQISQVTGRRQKLRNDNDNLPIQFHFTIFTIYNLAVGQSSESETQTQTMQMHTGSAALRYAFNGLNQGKAAVADANLRVNIWQVNVQLTRIFNLTELFHIE